MGHAQAIVNPIVYGLRWRASALKLPADRSANKLGHRQGATPRKGKGQPVAPARGAEAEAEGHGEGVPSVPPVEPAREIVAA